MNDFFHALGNLYSSTFPILEGLGNLPNVALIVVGFGFFFYWVGQMAKFEKSESK